jgi:hypothetical protein
MTDPPKEPNGLPTRLDNFMYLLSELEGAVELGGIEWDVASVDVAQRRLDRLAAIVQQIAAGFRRH